MYYPITTLVHLQSYRYKNSKMKNTPKHIPQKNIKTLIKQNSLSFYLDYCKMNWNWCYTMLTDPHSLTEK